MQVFNSIKEIQQWSLQNKKQGKTIGLVPTMGYLHNGHLSLVREARKQCDIVIVSIFVNPIQFGVNEDFDEYPRDIQRDQLRLEAEKADAIFAPAIKEMYPGGYNTYVEVLGEIPGKLCGSRRPGHFRGVTTVVSKLFNICLPDKAFFGQKDAQQALIVEKMVKELNFPLEIVRVPIVREEDGLAMSSRNVYLDHEQRHEALILWQALQKAQESIRSGETNVETVRRQIKQMIVACPQAQIDYIEIYNASDLADLQKIRGQVLIALAVKFGSTRLIDNLIVEV
ncbi:MAG: pantoate--beta-alanine ligase [Syntrophomonadaceae bacterium]|nr:pantoate--beta-alanine ligase [Syntrophomonadaceae bacterium]MDD3888902.1 pantoate--beta-alanine ligase [Syntrophomonadaceae bacterium]MDD4548926.1 pantoate--beta-alanine ligase [Syntrophomonadaceae bacterium]